MFKYALLADSKLSPSRLFHKHGNMVATAAPNATMNGPILGPGGPSPMVPPSGQSQDMIPFSASSPAPTTLGSNPGGPPKGVRNSKPATTTPGAVGSPAVQRPPKPSNPGKPKTPSLPMTGGSASGVATPKVPKATKATSLLTKKGNFAATLPMQAESTPSPEGTPEKTPEGLAVGHHTLQQDWKDTKRHAGSFLPDFGAHARSYLEGLGHHTLAHLEAANAVTLRPNDLIASRPQPSQQLGF